MVDVAVELVAMKYGDANDPATRLVPVVNVVVAVEFEK